jgi:hypothetical protein
VLPSRYNSCKWPTWRTIPFSICLFHFSTCFEQPRAHHQENQLYQYNIWYVSLWPSSIQVGKELPDLYNRRSPTQSDTYQMLYWYNWFSWWWARDCSNHVENWNKHIEKELCVKLVVYKNLTTCLTADMWIHNSQYTIHNTTQRIRIRNIYCILRCSIPVVLSYNIVYLLWPSDKHNKYVYYYITDCSLIM